MKYYRIDNGYIGVTSQSPKGMRGVVYVGRGPDHNAGIESVKEQAYSRDQLDRLEGVDPDQVPADWFEAIGLEERPTIAPEKPRVRVRPTKYRRPPSWTRGHYIALIVVMACGLLWQMLIWMHR